MHTLIKSLPDQLKEGYNSGPYEKREKPEVIYFFGMGGSGISGDLLKSYLLDISSVPLVVIKDYSIPVFCKKPLCIFVSYSGNTEETLECFMQTLKKTKNIFVVSSNGKLLSIAEKQKIEHYRVPSGLPPRCALGFIFSAILKFLESNVFMCVKNEIEEAIKLLSEKKEEYESKAQIIAERLLGRLPLIYTLSQKFYPVAYRFQCQLNENAKIFSHSHFIPEMNHNEIMGYMGFSEVNRLITVVYLISGEENDRNIKRKEILRNLLNVPFVDIHADGKSTIARFFSLIMQTDFVSLYLALKRNVNPFEIPLIDRLKKEIKGEVWM